MSSGLNMNSSTNVKMPNTGIDSSRIAMNSSESMSSSPSEENSNKYISLFLSIQHKEQVTKLVEFHKSLNDASNHISDCVFCKEERLRERLRNSVKLDSFIGNPNHSKIINAKYYKNSHNRKPRLQIDRRKKRVSFRI